MAKIKYYYDSETLSFKQINNRKRRLKYMLFYVWQRYKFHAKGKNELTN